MRSTLKHILCFDELTVKSDELWYFTHSHWCNHLVIHFNQIYKRSKIVYSHLMCHKIDVHIINSYASILAAKFFANVWWLWSQMLTANHKQMDQKFVCINMCSQRNCTCTSNVQSLHQWIKQFSKHKDVRIDTCSQIADKYVKMCSHLSLWSSQINSTQMFCLEVSSHLDDRYTRNMQSFWLFQRSIYSQQNTTKNDMQSLAPNTKTIYAVKNDQIAVIFPNQQVLYKKFLCSQYLFWNSHFWDDWSTVK